MEHQFYHISVRAEVQFVTEQSAPEQNRYVFAYTITIENTGSITAQLLNRHWLITDGNGKVQEVRGAGVVGEQPLLEPGEAFEYTSAAVIETAHGTMEGEYEMIAEEGTRFDAEIEPFSLSMSAYLH